MGNRRIVRLEKLVESLENNVILVLDTNIVIWIIEQAGEPLSTLLDEISEIVGKPVIVCPSSVIDELKRLALRHLRIRKLLNTLGSRYFPPCIIVETSAGGSADRDLQEISLELARQGKKVIVATNDVELRRRLRRMGIHVAYVRSASRSLTTSISGHI